MDFHVEHTDGAARAGIINTSRGSIKTPVFMPVATRSAVRALTGRDIDEIGFEIILANTYHLYLRPGTAIFEKAGGLHKFMNFHRPILTDSGGFQVFSINSLFKVRENGVEFRSHIDGSPHFFTPSGVLDIQKSIGSDIMMVLDHCPGYPSSRKQAGEAVNRTVNWARESFESWKSSFDIQRQALFAIVQGGVFPDLRKECAYRLMEMDFPGFAIGGLSVGEPGNEYRDITAFTTALLPADRPRYMMGVGSPMEILDAVKNGVDMFDCVMPTRIARNGTLFTTRGRINIKASSFQDDFGPPDPGCDCYVCRNYSRAYLRHLFKMGEIGAMIYNSYHNLYFMRNFMHEIRHSIITGAFESTYGKWSSLYARSA